MNFTCKPTIKKLAEELFNCLDLFRDGFRFIKRPIEQIALWRDYLQAKKRAKFIRDSMKGMEAKKRTVLIVAMDSRLFDVKQMSMLAVGLMREKWKPVVLLKNRRRQRWHKRFFHAYGLSEMIYWDDFPKSEIAPDRVESMLAKADTFKEVKNWLVDNCWIGPQILASISRSTFRGTPDVNDSGTKAQLRECLVDTLTRIPVARQVLERVRPSLMLLVEANYAKHAPLTDLAVNEKVDVIQIIQTSRDDAFVMRRLNRQTRREHPSSLERQIFMKIRDRKWTEDERTELNQALKARYNGKWFIQGRNQPGAKSYTKEELRIKLDLNPELKTAVVFSHVLWDANLFYGEDLFQDYGEWFAETVKAASSNPRINWIIKMHPANLWKRKRDGVTGEYSEILLIREFVGELPEQVKLLYPDTDISSLSLFELADFAITVRGTVSTEAPCFGVTTLTAGTGRCDRFGFTVDSDSSEEYLEKLDNIEQLPAISEKQMNWARRHAHAVFCRKPWEFRSWKASFDPSGRKHILEANLKLEAHSWEEIDSNGDLRLWAEWAADTSKVDYLE